MNLSEKVADEDLLCFVKFHVWIENQFMKIVSYFSECRSDFLKFIKFAYLLFHQDIVRVSTVGAS